MPINPFSLEYFAEHYTDIHEEDPTMDDSMRKRLLQRKYNELGYRVKRDEFDYELDKLCDRIRFKGIYTHV